MKLSFMKLTFLYCLLVALPILGFSQKPVKDAAKERNDLIKLKETLVKESASLQAEVDQEKILLDSMSRIVTMDSADVAKIKADPNANKSGIKNYEKKLFRFREQRDQMVQKINASKDQLKQSSDLINELDAQIRKLQQ